MGKLDYIDMYEVMRDQFTIAKEANLVHARKVFLVGEVDTSTTTPLGTCVPRPYSNHLLESDIAWDMFTLRPNPSACFHLRDSVDAPRSLVQLRNQLKQPKHNLADVALIKRRRKQHYLAEPRKNQNWIDAYFLFNRMLACLGLRHLVRGVRISCDLQQITIQPNSPLCLLCDCVVDTQTKQIRVTNIHKIGKGFQSLIHSLRALYSHRLRRNHQLKGLCL